MKKTQKVYYPIRRIERLLYATQVWYTFTDRQKDSIYETADVNYVQ
jgi:hypothetical protein